MDNISITYEEILPNNKIKRMIISTKCASINNGIKNIVCNSAQSCKTILKEVYLPIREDVYELYLQSPTIKASPKKRLEIIDEYDTYVFDLKYSYPILTKLIQDLESKIKSETWHPHDTKSIFKSAIEMSPFRHFIKKK